MRRPLGQQGGAQLGDSSWDLVESPVPAPSGPGNRRVLTVVGLGLDRADAQVLTEERHGGVLALATRAGHGAARAELRAKRAATTLRAAGTQRTRSAPRPAPQCFPARPLGETPCLGAPAVSGAVLATFNTSSFHPPEPMEPAPVDAHLAEEKAEAQKGSGAAGEQQSRGNPDLTAPPAPSNNLSPWLRPPAREPTALPRSRAPHRALCGLGPVLAAQHPPGTVAGTRGAARSQAQNRPRPPRGWTGIAGRDGGLGAPASPPAPASSLRPMTAFQNPGLDRQLRAGSNWELAGGSAPGPAPPPGHALGPRLWAWAVSSGWPRPQTAPAASGLGRKRGGGY